MLPTKKFTADFPEISTHFLDVTVSTADGIIETDLYDKPLDSH